MDIWSLGCILYTLLIGHPPFETESVHGTLDRVIAGDYSIPQNMNPAAADLIRSLLQSQPDRRPTLSDILEHPFMRINEKPRDRVSSNVLSLCTASRDTRSSGKSCLNVPFEAGSINSGG